MTDVTPRPRVLLCATTTGYQTRMFDDAAARLGVELVLATDRCDRLEDPWRDRAVAVRFHDEPGALVAIRTALPDGRLDGVLAVGDRPAVLAAVVADAWGLPWHSVAAARAARDKRRFRAVQQAAGLVVPRTITVPAGSSAVPGGVQYPCVVKPLVLSGSRGVMRADDAEALRQAMARVSTILASPDVREQRDDAATQLLIEDYVEGHEFAVEGLMVRGVFHTLAIFDKPDPLVGPFFEETIYVTPTAATATYGAALSAAVAETARHVGLWHGPVHAECRVSAAGIFVLEAAARPIGGLCARAVRLAGGRPLEQVLMAHAVGGEVPAMSGEGASGVMMVPIPRAGVLRAWTGEAEARAVLGITDVVVSAVSGQVLQTLPEAASYLGFIFAEAADDHAVLTALTAAHAALHFTIAPMVALQRDGA